MKTKKIKLEEALNHIDKTFSEVEETVEKASKPKRKCGKKKVK